MGFSRKSRVCAVGHSAIGHGVVGHRHGAVRHCAVLFVNIDKSSTAHEAGNPGATALASGLAALVLFCMRRRGYAVPEDVPSFIDRVMTNDFNNRDGSSDQVVHVSVLRRALGGNISLSDLAGKFKAQVDR